MLSDLVKVMKKRNVVSKSIHTHPRMHLNNIKRREINMELIGVKYGNYPHIYLGSENLVLRARTERVCSAVLDRASLVI
jgi:hypothetical protein